MGVDHEIPIQEVVMKFVTFLKLIGFLVFLLPWNEVLASQFWVKPINGLDQKEQLEFWSGFSLFRDPWVLAPASTKGRDGLGPLFNARSCMACHPNGGDGQLLGEGFGSVIRVSDRQGQPLDYYGKQLQDLSSDTLFAKGTNSKEKHDRVQAEATIKIKWQTIQSPHHLPLRFYEIELEDLGYGEIPTMSQFSVRFAPPLYGLGWLEKVDENQILQYSDEQDHDKDGISGRPNWVLDIRSGEKRLGRFGWKAEQPSLIQQVALALVEDIGITSTIYPRQNCAPEQHRCISAVHGGNEEGVEITDVKLSMLESFVTHLRSAEGDFQGDKVQKKLLVNGEALFKKVGCASCHRLYFTVDQKRVYAFSDLLLHDMGEGLADQFQSANATAGELERARQGELSREWRTPPLWGMNRRFQKQPQYFLHDGRANSLIEAIAWHGGEATASREHFFQLSEEQQGLLKQFLKSL